MELWKPGDSAQIVDMPPNGQHLIGQMVSVVAIGGFGLSPDDVAVRTSAGLIHLRKEQIAKVRTNASDGS